MGMGLMGLVSNPRRQWPGPGHKEGKGRLLIGRAARREKRERNGEKDEMVLNRIKCAPYKTVQFRRKSNSMFETRGYIEMPATVILDHVTRICFLFGFLEFGVMAFWVPTKYLLVECLDIPLGYVIF